MNLTLRRRVTHREMTIVNAFIDSGILPSPEHCTSGSLKDVFKVGHFLIDKRIR